MRIRRGEKVLKIACFGKSDVGLRRTNNEDAFWVAPELGLAGLADGMGGAAAGELASHLFTHAVTEVSSSMGEGNGFDSLEPVEKSFELANQRILNHVKEHPGHTGMGCTGELLALSNHSYYLGHVGDSRTYLFRQGELKQLTRDHSFVQDLVDKGVITPDEARTHRLRHVIMRAVGTRETLEVELGKGEVAAGDLFLLCSDGLTDMVEDELIQQVLSMPIELAVKAGRLIEAANAAGGRDNVTVVLIEVLPAS
jgi:PPM family protein phosphatase